MFSENLTKAMAASENYKTQESLAKAVGVSQTAIYKMLSGDTTRTRFINEIARALNVRPEWLLQGKGEMRPERGLQRRANPFESGTRQYWEVIQALESGDDDRYRDLLEEAQQVQGQHKAPITYEDRPLFSIPATESRHNQVRESLHSVEIKGKIPLISWVTAGQWDEVMDNYHPGDGEDMLLCPVNHGPHTYAVRVSGDSMTTGYGKSYPDGCIIFVDPDQAAAPGDRVVAKINGDDKVTFKQLSEDCGRPFLKPLNPQYAPIRDHFTVIGKVIGKWESE